MFQRLTKETFNKYALSGELWNPKYFCGEEEFLLKSFENQYDICFMLTTGRI